MGLRVIKNQEDGYQCIYDSTTMIPFGIVHTDDVLDLKDFLEWLPKSNRNTSYLMENFMSLYYGWLNSFE